MVFANLHTHTVFSDGVIEPAELVEQIYATPDLLYFALTDHDTMSGIEPLFRAKKEIDPDGHRLFIPGVEMTLSVPDVGRQVHVISLFPHINEGNYREALRPIAEKLDGYFHGVCERRGQWDIDGRLQTAFDLDLAGIRRKHAMKGLEAYNVAQRLRSDKTAEMRAVYSRLKPTTDVMAAPIPATYQAIIDNWTSITQGSSTEEIDAYICRPTDEKIARLEQILTRQGVGDARDVAKRTCGVMRPMGEQDVMHIRDGLDAVKSLGAKTFIAHPPAYAVDLDVFDEKVIKKYAAEGLLDGIEVFYPYGAGKREALTQRYLQLAKRQGMLISGGTDYHGDCRGHTLTAVTLPSEFIPAIIGRRVGSVHPYTASAVR